MLNFAKKLKVLKGRICSWVKDKKEKLSSLRISLKEELADIDSSLKMGGLPFDMVFPNVLSHYDLSSGFRRDFFQKDEIKQAVWDCGLDKSPGPDGFTFGFYRKFWSLLEDDVVNAVCFFYSNGFCLKVTVLDGLVNEVQSAFIANRQILDDGEWIEDPNVVKNEFLSHCRNRFDSPCNDRLTLDMVFPNVLSHDQAQDLERAFSKDEIKKAVLDCGLDKSPGPDGFTFGFYCKFWSLLEDDVIDAVCFYLFQWLLSQSFLLIALDGLVNEVQSAFIANRQILDGPFILNELIHLCKAKKKQSLIFKVDFEKAFDSVRWDFLDDILKKFGFGPRWRDWIQSCLKSSRGSILVNGSPTSEFQFYKGLKQGDPLSPLLFILVMESLHLSFHNVVNAGLFKGVGLDNSLQLSHLFYADDVVFIGQWCDSNLATIMRVLECFFRASGLRINRQKCGLMGIAVEPNKIANAAKNLGCKILKTPFSYLGVNIGGNMTRINSWDVVINKTLSRLSKWKLKVLSIGGRLTLLKSVLGSISIYYMSMFRAPIQVINKLESIRSHFFNGVDHNVRKMSFVNWKNVLASKEKGGLGVSSFFALN
ncbi:RNA-directed DNA polymerase, eukaryota, partial [Tanacetum coccineum]